MIVRCPTAACPGVIGPVGLSGAMRCDTCFFTSDISQLGIVPRLYDVPEAADAGE